MHHGYFDSRYQSEQDFNNAYNDLKVKIQSQLTGELRCQAEEVLSLVKKCRKSNLDSIDDLHLLTKICNQTRVVINSAQTVMLNPTHQQAVYAHQSAVKSLNDLGERVYSTSYQDKEKLAYGAVVLGISIMVATLVIMPVCFGIPLVFGALVTLVGFSKIDDYARQEDLRHNLSLFGRMSDQGISTPMELPMDGYGYPILRKSGC